MVPNIDVNLSNEPRHFGVNIHLLVRAKGSRKSERVYNRSSLSQNHRNRPKQSVFVLICLRRFRRKSQQRDQAHRRCDCRNTHKLLRYDSSI